MSSLGRHIIVEYYGCDPGILNDVVRIEETMVNAAEAANATVINSTFHYFSPFGTSGVVVIVESHLAIHTWPEYGYAAVDLFTCGDTIDPWISYRFLKDALSAEYASAMEMKRGQSSELPRINLESMEGRPEERNQFKSNRNLWFTERSNDIALSLRHQGDRLFQGQSPFQKVEVYDTFAYGRLLTLDGLITTSEKDEYVYHEMIAHIPMQAHSSAQRVLVIGGGDGGVIREIFRYPQIEEVVMVEIDQMVVEASREFLPGIASEFDNPLLNLHHEDGIQYVAECGDELFDIVIVDMSNPIGRESAAAQQDAIDFYQNLHRILKPNGILVTQSESPRFNAKVFQDLFACYRDIFGTDKVHCYLAYIPTYPSGMWALSFSSKGDIHPIQDFSPEVADQFADQHGLQYYNADIHSAAFALPGFVRNLLKPSSHEPAR